MGRKSEFCVHSRFAFLPLAFIAVFSFVFVALWGAREAFAQQITGEVTTIRLASGCTRIAVTIRSGNNVKNVHLLIGRTAHEPGLDRTVFGDPIREHYKDHKEMEGWKYSIEPHDLRGGGINNPPPNYLDWWISWTITDGNAGELAVFQVDYCGGKGSVDFKILRESKVPILILTKNGQVYWTDADKLPFVLSLK